MTGKRTIPRCAEWWDGNVPRTVAGLLFLLLCLASTGQTAPTGGERARMLMRQAADVQFSNPKQSIYYAQQAVEAAGPHEGKNDLKAEALLLQATAQRLLGEFDSGLKTLYESQNCLTPDNRTLQGKILACMSLLYCRLTDYQRAIACNDRATAIFKATQDSAQIAACYNNRGIIHAYLGEHPIAEQFFLQALAINRSLKDLKHVATNLNNLCLYEGNTAEKLNFIQEAIAINKNLNATWSLAENYNNMAKQYFYAKDYPNALQALHTAHGIAAEIGAKELVCDNYEYSSWVYAATGDYRNAYHYLQQLTNLGKEIQSGSKLRNAEQEIAQKRYQEQEKAAQIKEREYRIQLLRRKQYLLSVTVVSLLVAAFLLYKWYRRKKNLELMEARYNLEQSQREIAELKVHQQKLELQNVQSALEDSRQEATSFALFLQAQGDLLGKISDLIKQGYKMPPAELGAHLKKINAFIRQHQSGDQTNILVLQNIEEKNHEFLQRLTQKHPDLTQGEKYLATLLRAELSNKEISMLTGTQPKSINMNRYRLRKSLGLLSDENLKEYLQGI